MIVVSACLAGLKVRYNGSHRLDQRIEEFVQEGKAVTVCPELLGGFSTPRPPAEIIGEMDMMFYGDRLLLSMFTELTSENVCKRCKETRWNRFGL
ncbi:DUF523 domain-containing protein [Bacillus sp. SL00103]